MYVLFQSPITSTGNCVTLSCDRFSVDDMVHCKWSRIKMCFCYSSLNDRKKGIQSIQLFSSRVTKCVSVVIVSQLPRC